MQQQQQMRAHADNQPIRHSFSHPLYVAISLSSLLLPCLSLARVHTSSQRPFVDSFQEIQNRECGGIQTERERERERERRDDKGRRRRRRRKCAQRDSKNAHTEKQRKAISNRSEGCSHGKSQTLTPSRLAFLIIIIARRHHPLATQSHAFLLANNLGHGLVLFRHTTGGSSSSSGQCGFQSYSS
jgi:hypothetical protein